MRESAQLSDSQRANPSLNAKQGREQLAQVNHEESAREGPHPIKVEVGLPTAVGAQERVILQTNIHLWSKSAVNVRVLIPHSRAIAPRGNWKKKSAQ